VSPKPGKVRTDQGEKELNSRCHEVLKEQGGDGISFLNQLAGVPPGGEELTGGESKREGGEARF